MRTVALMAIFEFHAAFVKTALPDSDKAILFIIMVCCIVADVMELYSKFRK